VGERRGGIDGDIAGWGMEGRWDEGDARGRNDLIMKEESELTAPDMAS
jgi:hypothetical protein